MMEHWKRITAAISMAAAVGAACTTTSQPEVTYVTDYRIVDDRSVKYLYLTGQHSLAGSAYDDQALAIEICSVEREIDEDTGEEGQVVETDCEKTRIVRTEEYR